MSVFGALCIGLAAGSQAQTLTVEGANSPYAFTSSFPAMAYKSIIVGDTGTGTFNHNSGTIAVSAYEPGSIILGNGVGGNGTYNLEGTSYLSANTLIIGDQGSGTFNQDGSGSILQVEENLYLSSKTSPVAGTSNFNMNGGSLYVRGTAYLGTSASSGPGNPATFTLTGGGAGLTTVQIGNGTINLNGGMLVTNQITGTSASVVNFNGGTVNFSNAFTGPVFTGIGTLNVRGGGAILSSGASQLSTSYSSFVHSSMLGDPAIDGGMTIEGYGIIGLAVPSTYNGPTVVVGGALEVTNTYGSATGTGTVTVQRGAVLTGTGIITGPVMIEAGGTVLPGTSGKTGTLSLQTELTLESSAIYALNLGFTTTTANVALLHGGGLVSLGGATLQITNSGYAPALGDIFTIITDAGSLGEFASGSTVTDSSHFTYAITYGVSSVSLEVIALPEPGTWIMVGIAAISLVPRLRRRMLLSGNA